MPPAVVTSPQIPVSRYEARRGEVLLHMSHFFLGYLNSLYEQFDGDLALVIVLGEISHHNTAKAFSPDELSNDRMQQIQQHGEEWDAMQGCNAYSLSCATRIPRETVRRKIAELKRRGWVEELPGKGLRITPACADHFAPDFSLNILRRMLKAARTIEHVLGISGSKAHSAPGNSAKSAAISSRKASPKTKNPKHP